MPKGAKGKKAGSRRGREIISVEGFTITRRLDGDTPAGKRGEDCCFTFIKFKKLYPADMTVTLTTSTGRTVQRTFTRTKTKRTAFIKTGGDDENDEDQTGIVIGGLGRCVDVDVSIVDTSTAALTTAHYVFRLCCDDTGVQKTSRLIYRAPPNPGGQRVRLPLLKIKDLRRDPCP